MKSNSCCLGQFSWALHTMSQHAGCHHSCPQCTHSTLAAIIPLYNVCMYHSGNHHSSLQCMNTAFWVLSLHSLCIQYFCCHHSSLQCKQTAFFQSPFLSTGPAHSSLAATTPLHRTWWTAFWETSSLSPLHAHSIVSGTTYIQLIQWEWNSPGD